VIIQFRDTVKKKDNAQEKLFSAPAAPDKLAFRFEEVSRLTKVPSETIEAWEQEFSFLRSGRTSEGQRFFRPKDIEIIRRIKELLDEKSLTMAGIKRRIEEEFGLRPAAGPIHPDKLKRTLCDVKEELQNILDTLAKNSKKA
jgi:DNA-binding transcriptional MerR regulator